ncbi:hypothetical protein [Rhodococcus sp. H29-C3]|uniref:hypothetical protein n=1 Tax=Rhodococcus sp. H29-C3 TaxID=3046307 RepID=UPI0024BA0761|nr:hypothetical protein [Rhodococcus sp. H29-C3]MDJ0362860.1 hypothetical protein [Rhodococcus sp. H29-C3]
MDPSAPCTPGAGTTGTTGTAGTAGTAGAAGSADFEGVGVEDVAEVDVTLDVEVLGLLASFEHEAMNVTAVNAKPSTNNFS